MKSPLISVVMPVWNGETYLREAIESILNQTFRDFEFLILDDGSTDSSKEIIREYAEQDQRIRSIPLGHQGIVVALNRGVHGSRADWIARMDCDDIAHPQRLEKQWQAIRCKPDVVLCHTNVKLMGTMQLPKQARFPRTEALLRLKLCFLCPIVHPTVVFRKDAFEKAGGYLPEERHAEDYGLWGRLLEHGSVVGVSDSLLQLRIHQDSISRQKSETQKRLGIKIGLRHCQQFMRLSYTEAERAHSAMRHHDSDSGFRDWCWLLIRCLPCLRQQSLELWLWASWKSLQQIGDNNNR